MVNLNKKKAYDMFSFFNRSLMQLIAQATLTMCLLYQGKVWDKMTQSQMCSQNVWSKM